MGADPRKLIRDFYQTGDSHGPLGVKRLGPCSEPLTQWFAIFRPTSRDAIAKMLGGVAVGKGLNVKGKSAKKGVLSGFVPFLQISENHHKEAVEKPCIDATFKIFYQTQEAQLSAFRQLETIARKIPPRFEVHYWNTSRNSKISNLSLLSSLSVSSRVSRAASAAKRITKVLPSFSSSISITPRKTKENRRTVNFSSEVNVIDPFDDQVPCLHRSTRTFSQLSIITILEEDFEHSIFGLEVPEHIVHEAFILQPDVAFQQGWETGRQSQPEFLNMNLQSLRSSQPPEVVLFQFDKGDPMNPHGLLMAYAEETHVKPVVSDFDLFLVGSRGMVYDSLPEDQQALALWSLERTSEILKLPGEGFWNESWLEVLKTHGSKVVLPAPRPYGNGDETSCRLTGDAVESTKESGAIRHGAECFNFYFPQELDEEYLIIWEKFDTWEYRDEPGVRSFLKDRIADGYIFPLNPVWPIRDEGWYEIYAALKHSGFFPKNLDEKIEAIRKELRLCKLKRSYCRDDLNTLENADLVLHRASTALHDSDWQAPKISHAPIIPHIPRMSHISSIPFLRSPRLETRQ